MQPEYISVRNNHIKYLFPKDELNKFEELKKALERENFDIGKQGHIVPKNIPDGYLSTHPWRKVPAPVGFIGSTYQGEGYFFIQFLNEPSVKKFADKLKDICDKL
jgi:hypothetical protein